MRLRTPIGDEEVPGVDVGRPFLEVDGVDTAPAEVRGRGVGDAPARLVELGAAGLQPGDSGGALIDAEGRVVGVAFAIAPDRDGVAYALDVSEAPAEVTYRSEDGAKVLPPIVEPLADIDRLYNRVTFYKAPVGTDTPAIYAEATVTNRSSPVHPERLAERLGQVAGILPRQPAGRRRHRLNAAQREAGRPIHPTRRRRLRTRRPNGRARSANT